MTVPDLLDLLDPAAAELFFDPRSLYLAPFVAGPRSVRSAARELGIAPSTLRLWVGKFRAAGVLVAAGAGQYRLAARTLRVWGTRVATLDEVLHLNRPWWHALMHAIVVETAQATDGMVTTVARGEDGRGHLRARPTRQGQELGGADLPPTLHAWGRLHLGPEAARAFEADLRALLATYHARSGDAPDLPPYLVHLALVRDHGPAEDT